MKNNATTKALIITNILAIFVAGNIFILSHVFSFDINFIRGVYVGLFVSIAAYDVITIRALKTNKTELDERYYFIHQKACNFVFAVFTAATAMFSILSRAENFLSIPLSSFLTYQLNGIIVLYVIAFAYLWKRY